MRRVEGSWKTIDTVLQENAHSVYKALRPPISELHLERLQSALATPLPRCLEQSLRVHDGMRRSYLGRNRLINSWALLPASKILSVWKMEWSLQQECAFGGCQLTKTKDLKNDTRWRAAWIPMLDFEGDKLVIDLDPGPKGKSGHLFRWYNYGGSPMEVVAPSWIAWLDRLANELVNRRFTLDKWGGIQLDNPTFA